MQLHYNILWIDDEIEKLNESGDLEQIKEYLKEMGFNPFLLPLSDGKDIYALLKLHKFDLIISDYNIEEGHQGDEIIKEIRKQKINNEILFYSSQTDLNEIAMKLLGYDRISFHSGRRGLTNKIEELIALSVAKLIELTAMRGLITAETSELDVIIEQIVMDLVFNKLKLQQDELDKIINFYVSDFLNPGPDKFLKYYDENGFQNSFHKIEASRKWGMLRDLLKKNPTNEVKDFLEKNKTYGDQVIAVRNKFAHAKSIVQEGKPYLSGFGSTGKPFMCDDQECINIRKNLILHRENITMLTEHLGISKAE